MHRHGLSEHCCRTTRISPARRRRSRTPNRWVTTACRPWRPRKIGMSRH